MVNFFSNCETLKASNDMRQIGVTITKDGRHVPIFMSRKDEFLLGVSKGLVLILFGFIGLMIYYIAP